MKGHEKLRHNSSKVNVDDNGKTPKLRSLHIKLEKGARTKKKLPVTASEHCFSTGVPNFGLQIVTSGS